MEEFKKLLELGNKVNKRHNDAMLTRFLTARSDDVEEAVKMFEEAEAWRVAQDVDGLVREYAYTEAAAVDQLYCCYWHKTCRLGRPIVINEMQFLDCSKLFEMTTEDRFIKEHIRDTERTTEYKLPACFKSDERCQRQIFNLIDLKGASLSEFAKARQIIRKIAKIDSDYYPENLGVMIMINAPYIFTSIWAVCRNFLDAKTLSKIIILGSNYRDTLHELVDDSNLPAFLGGTCDCKEGCRQSDCGPWNDGTVEGYPIEFWEAFKTRDYISNSDPIPIKA